MDMLPSLCAAMERAGGDCLILREGQPPHVVSGTTRHDVARAVLSHNALEALVVQIFSESARLSLSETGIAVESVNVPGMNLSLTAKAENTGQGLLIELSRTGTAATVDAPVDEPAHSEPMHSELSVPPPAAWSEQPSDPRPVGQDHSEPVGQDHPLTALVPADEDVPATEYLTTDFSPAPAVSEAWRADESWVAKPPMTSFHEPQTTDDADVTPPAHTAAAPVNVTPFIATTSAMPAMHIPSVSETDSAGLMAWVAKAASSNATALYLRAGTPPIARIEERLESLGSDPVDASVFEQLLIALDNGLDRSWQPGTDGEWIRNDEGLGRVSCKFFTDDLGPGLVVRLRRQPAPAVLHRHIPRKVKGCCDGDGLVVVSAATPADLLSIASAVADWAGRRRGGYVVTLRPEGTPRHDITGAFVSQRELGGSDADIAAAVRNAAAESPDVLLVAPPHSETAMREAVHATDGGRLVILAVLAPTSMHALRAISGRSISGGDAPNRLALATSFRASFTYRGLRRLGGGRTLIQDLIIGTSDVSALLASGDFAGITRIQRSGAVGMHTVDETLARAVKRGHLSLRQSAAQAVDRRHLISLVRAARRASTSTRSPRNATEGRAPVVLEDLLQAVGGNPPGSRRRWADD